MLPRLGFLWGGHFGKPAWSTWVKVFVSSEWLEKNNGGWGPKKIRRALWKNACKTFFLANFFPLRVLKMKPISLGGDFQAHRWAR